MRRLALLILGFVSIAGCKQETPCAVPSGAYTMQLKGIHGTCPDNIVSQFEAFSDGIDVPKGQECKRFITAVGGEIPEPKCDMKMDISAEANAKGLHDGQGVFNLTCADGFMCRHTFALQFQKAADPAAPVTSTPKTAEPATP